GVPRAGRATLERLCMPTRYIIHEGERPGPLWTNDSRKPACQVVRDEPPNQIALGHRSRAVDHARIQTYERTPVTDVLYRNAIGSDFGPLVIVRDNWRRFAMRRQCQERRCVHDARYAGAPGRCDGVAQAADIDLVEILPAPLPDADERGRMH